MDNYLDILKDKANKIDAKIEKCGFDKDCIKDAIALKVKEDLQNENIETLKDKATQIKADYSKCLDDKECILQAIKERVKEVLEEENELHMSIDNQQNFIPLDLG